jgi:small subunit ribosomal protein S16
MVRIRLTRVGRTNMAYWRIGVFDSRTRRDGKPIEYVGSYNPHAKKAEEKLTVNRERVEHWLSKGAQLTDSVAALLKSPGAAVKA